MPESIQHVLSRVRPPRVQITYDVQVGDAFQKKELPFIVGVMADLSGKPEAPPPKLKERKFVEIDRDNFDAVLGSIHPRLAFRVPDRLRPGSDQMLNVALTFNEMADFNPVNVVQQIAPLKELYQARNRLRDLLAKLDGNDELDSILTEIVTDSSTQAKLRDELQAATQAPAAAAPATGAPAAQSAAPAAAAPASPPAPPSPPEPPAGSGDPPASPAS
jgi:type VI secretion system protein ImpB